MNRLHLTIKEADGTFIGFAPHNQGKKVGCRGIDFYFMKWRLHIGYYYGDIIKKIV